MENRGLAMMVCNSFMEKMDKRILPDWDELEQEAMIALERACRYHDPARGTIGTFAYLIIRQHLWQVCNRRKNAAGEWDEPVTILSWDHMTEPLDDGRLLGTGMEILDISSSESAEDECLDNLPSEAAMSFNLAELVDSLTNWSYGEPQPTGRLGRQEWARRKKDRPLTPRQGAFVKLRYIDDLEYREIAKLDGCSHQAVHLSIRNSLKIIGRELDGEIFAPIKST